MTISGITSRLNELRRHPGFRRNPPLVALRVMRWALHCMLRRPARIRFSDAEFSLFLPPKWRGGGSTAVYLFREMYEPEFQLLEQLVRPGMVFVDGGANTGAFAFAAAQRVGATGKVIAFEPGDRCFAALQRSLALNAVENVVLRQEAISDKDGIARLYKHLGRDNQFSLGSDGDEQAEVIEINTISLATVLQELDIDRIDFLKLDIEGAQELALRGGWELITRNHPPILIENNEEACGRLGLDPDGAFTLLAEEGYEFFQVVADGRWRRLPNPPGMRTVLAVHPDTEVATGNME